MRAYTDPGRRYRHRCHSRPAPRGRFIGQNLLQEPVPDTDTIYRYNRAELLARKQELEARLQWINEQLEKVSK